MELGRIAALSMHFAVGFLFCVILTFMGAVIGTLLFY